MFFAIDRQGNFVGNLGAGSQDLRGTKVIWSKASDTSIYNLTFPGPKVDIGLDVQLLILDQANETVTANINLPRVVGGTANSNLRLTFEVGGNVVQTLTVTVGNNPREFSYFGGNIEPLSFGGLVQYQLRAQALNDNITIDNSNVGTNFVAQYVPLDQAGR